MWTIEELFSLGRIDIWNIYERYIIYIIYIIKEKSVDSPVNMWNR